MSRPPWHRTATTPRQRAVLWLIHTATQRGNPLRWQAHAALRLAEWIGGW